MKRTTLTVIFHNAKGYDSHFIVRDGLKYFSHWTSTVIANTFEKYLNVKMSFKYNEVDHHITIIDSLQFLNASLARLVQNCTRKQFISRVSVSDEVKFGKGVQSYLQY